MAKKPPDKRVPPPLRAPRADDDDDPELEHELDQGDESDELEHTDTEPPPKPPLARTSAVATSDPDIVPAPPPPATGCRCTKNPCPCICHSYSPAAPSRAMAMRPHDPITTVTALRVRGLDRKEHLIAVCWPQDEVDKAHARHPDGVVDLARVLSPTYKSMGTVEELRWLAAQASAQSAQQKRK